MNKALIIKGNDRHTYRLEDSLTMCGVQFRTVSSYEEIPTERCDVVFVDPSVDYDPTSKIQSDIVMFFDCEDSPSDFELGVAFNSMKDNVKYYAKMNWVLDDIEGVKLIGFPIAHVHQVIQIANIEVPEFSYSNAVPFFLGAPTFLGRHTPVEGGGYHSTQDTSSLAMYEDHYMYNQRVDWLLSLRKSNIPYLGGLVFKTDNLTAEWQSKYFGDGVVNLGANPMNRQEFFNTLFNCRVGLNPTGHDRNSWRIYDLMAAGSILISTDLMNQKSLYMPKEYITIKDGEDLGSTLLSVQPDYNDVWHQCQANREVLKSLTPEKILSDFTGQLG